MIVWINALSSATSRPGLTHQVAVAVANASEALGGAIERLFPARLAEMRVRVRRVDIGVVLGKAVLADQRLGQPVGVVGVVEAEAALDAEPVVIGRPVLALDGKDAVLADLVGELAADPTIGAHTVDLALGSVDIDAVRIDQGRRHQRAGWAGLA